MTSASISTEFIACGCSKTPHSLDWDVQCGFVAFGSSRNVCILKPAIDGSVTKISKTFKGHEQDVTCVKFVKSVHGQSNRKYIVSCGGNKAVFWHFNFDLTPLAEMTHTLSCTHACGLSINDNRVIVVTCGADSMFKIFHFDENQGLITQSQKFDYGNGFALCSDICRTEKGGILIAVGTDSNKINVYYQSYSDKTFDLAVTLLGHEDWIRDVSFSQEVFVDSILLASCSQDKYSRVWSFAKRLHQSSEISSEDGIRLRKHQFLLGDDHYCEATLETVLAGHDSWVYSVRWFPGNPRQLLTSSLDKSLFIWEFDTSSGIWIVKTQLGEVGGPVAGFYGAVFSPDGKAIIAHSFTGGLYCWRRFEDNEWRISVVPTGHSNSVEDIDWEPEGQYLLSCSADQTTRLFAKWRKEGCNDSYAEISRPQVHGHDMQCLAVVNRFCFVSGSEEKILRAFVAPTNFVENLCKFSALNSKLIDEFISKYGKIEGASLPALGLSNKAVYADDLESTQTEKKEDASNERYPLFYYDRVELSEPPSEDFLVQNTLWPEVHKLYGHGYEVFSVASNHKGTLIASACKASKAEYAKVILWSTKDWQQKAQLDGHALTVTQIMFSPDDRYLLSVSRDRTWILYANSNEEFVWQKVAAVDKKSSLHSRIIWGCSWTHDSKYFTTVSRDQKLVVWNVEHCVSNNISSVTETLDTMDSATAVACAPKALKPGCYLIATGLENGQILLIVFDSISRSLNILRHSKCTDFGHALTVKKLKFRPQATNTLDQDDEYSLASCSDDHTVKIHKIKLKLE